MRKVIEEHIWISRPEAIRILQCGQGTFNRLVEAGRIRFRDYGRNRYLLADVEAAIQPTKPTQSA